ncbi:MAG: FkbM family methyltransferase [Acidobacteriota bacterium]
MRSFKEAARAITPPLVWSSFRTLWNAAWGRRVVPSVHRYFGLQDLDKKLEKYLDFDGGFFIEIGGWDGTTFSNSLYFERYRNWRGVLIEPSPSEYLKCRRDRPEAKVFCFACVPFDYPDKYVPMIYCASMTVSNVRGSDGVGLDPIEHVRDGRKFLAPGEDVYEFGAVAKPLSSILTENQINDSIDLLVLDVEGYELAVLQGLDFKLHGPLYICVEAWELEKIQEFLRSKGYDLVEQLSKHDYLFRLAEANERFADRRRGIRHGKEGGGS